MEPIKELLESILDDTGQLERYITEPKGLIFDDLSKTQRHFHRTPNPSRIFKMGPSPLNTTLKVDRDLISGALLGFHEVELSSVGKTSKTSTSMKRAPGPPEESVRGSSTNVPFWPGGMDEPTIEDLNLNADSNGLDFENELETVPPGFDFGMVFPTEKLEVDAESSSSSSINNLTSKKRVEINIAQLLMDTDDDLAAFNDEITSITVDRNGNSNENTLVEAVIKETKPDETDEVIDTIASKVSNLDDVLVISKESDPSKTVMQKTDWAEEVNVNNPVSDFYKRVPVMAKTWPFELDNFQKQAILRLERHESVFVAAHTSAGKTVVAEYAIALSFRHMTRAIYTSPIKALSNQKYRDFKDTFEDVGLLTGDIQINSKAACLIMTTEILRSMLYNGSDTIRDLEWVIFDEVHYINDAERGVVWEEVLIMLPRHVNIVLLSATVPNTLQFADWIGRTKRKKIYVISTPKRPVPLEHHLFVSSAKGKEKLFQVVKADGKLDTFGYTAALEAQKENKSAAKQYGPIPSRTALSFQQERTIYLTAVQLLKKMNQLPVVIFTFSRKRCDTNARMMNSMDLTTASEKNRIRMFVGKCVTRLKDSDRNLPQVKTMEELLSHGIGIHHSGILPILKEVVELLFQQGLVKLLFATETFAMGVNMPARTVVFDAIRKFDGVKPRNLNTAEYIQMAGRAGRRGLDTTGTVIVLCKDTVPELSELNAIMLGKPTMLESRFRLTYTMILNLLSVENITMEDMMKRSFFEVENQKNIPVYEERLKQLNKQVSTLSDVVACNICNETLQQYYNRCKNYVELRQEIRATVLTSPNAITVGRVVIVSATGRTRPTYAIVLKVATQKETTVVTVLTTRNSEMHETKEADQMWPHFINAHRMKVIIPEGIHETEVVQCLLNSDILLITTRFIRIETTKVLNDWDKRQIPRFKDDPPGKSFMSATEELTSISYQMGSNPEELDPIQHLGLKNLELHDKCLRLKRIREELDVFQCVTCSSFEEHFYQIYKNMKVKEALQSIRQHMDNRLVLEPECKSRIEVLKELKYIDSNCILQLKGRVARQIGQHELIITELILENMFTEMQPAEIAALLSCMVFEDKHSSKADLNEILKQGMQSVLDVARRIGKVQYDKGVQIAVEDYVKQFNFNLAEVVYEWARGTSFTDIMPLTDVQEGVIVRCIQRLDEILRDVKDAAKTVGNPVLQKKMEEASQAIKRDIVFAASLYIQ